MMREYDYAIVKHDVPLAALERASQRVTLVTFSCRPCHWPLSDYVAENINHCVKRYTLEISKGMVIVKTFLLITLLDKVPSVIHYRLGQNGPNSGGINSIQSLNQHMRLAEPSSKRGSPGSKKKRGSISSN